MWRDTSIKMYKPQLCQHCFMDESWVLTKQESHMQAVEMQVLQSCERCMRWDRLRNAENKNRLQIYNLQDKITESRRRWIDPHERTQTDFQFMLAMFWSEAVLGVQEKGSNTKGSLCITLRVQKKKKVNKLKLLLSFCIWSFDYQSKWMSDSVSQYDNDKVSLPFSF